LHNVVVVQEIILGIVWPSSSRISSSELCGTGCCEALFLLRFVVWISGCEIVTRAVAVGLMNNCRVVDHGAAGDAVVDDGISACLTFEQRRTGPITAFAMIFLGHRSSSFQTSI